MFHEQIFIDYTEKEVPQPQVEVALGLDILKYDPIISSTKSRFDPCTNPSEVWSIKTFTLSKFRILAHIPYKSLQIFVILQNFELNFF